MSDILALRDISLKQFATMENGADSMSDVERADLRVALARGLYADWCFNDGHDPEEPNWAAFDAGGKLNPVGLTAATFFAQADRIMPFIAAALSPQGVNAEMLAALRKIRALSDGLAASHGGWPTICAIATAAIVAAEGLIAEQQQDHERGDANG